MSEESRRVPPKVAEALNADESSQLDDIVRAGRDEDLEALRTVALDETAVDVPNGRTKAIYALGRWGDPALPEILERILPALDERGRIAALDALGRYGHESNLGVILPYAENDSEQVRKAAIKALARIGGDQAATALNRIAAADPAPWVRDLAGYAARGRNL